MLWERAADAAAIGASWAVSVEHAGRARGYYLQHGHTRAAARAQAIAGRALRMWGHHAEARAQLTAAAEILRAEPDADTVRALRQLATLHVFAGSPDADRLTSEALILGQALDVSTRELTNLLAVRGIYLATAERRLQAIAYLHESARLATQAEDNRVLGDVLTNLSDVLAVTEPAAAAEAARTAAGHLRRVGDRHILALAIANLAQALLLLGDWDAAETEITQAMDADGLADIEYFACYRGWLAAMRGDTETAEITLAAQREIQVSEDPQDMSLISLVKAFTAAARGEPQNALRHARGTLAHAEALGISAESLRWAWPLAARAACELRDTAATTELLTMLDSYQPGHVPPMLGAERDLCRARLASGATGATGQREAATAAFAAAISRLREQSTPYHLAHGLLDQAQHLARLDDNDAAAVAIEEARDIARRLHCQPLLDRTADITSAELGIQAQTATPRH